MTTTTTVTTVCDWCGEQKPEEFEEQAGWVQIRVTEPRYGTVLYQGDACLKHRYEVLEKKR